MDSILEENSNNNKFESLESEAHVNHLQCMNKNKKYSKFHETLNNIFGDHLNDERFLKRQEQLEIKQKIYHTWIKHTINVTDGRNGHNIAKIS